MPVDLTSVSPGSTIHKGDTELALLGTPIKIGDTLPSVALVDAVTMQDRDLAKERGKVLFLSIVPSIDTKVCEEQTHYLGEKGDVLPAEVKRMTISRDTPFAQKRFADEAKLSDVTFLSDYKSGEFGKAVGLFVDNLSLLARSVILVDKAGLVQYIPVVPEISHLPDMETALLKARELAGK
jgi:thiol peroxidase